jgi:outer membrane receptor protein involved in Fe transport
LVGARLGVVYGSEKPITLTLWVSNLFNDRMELNSRLKIGVPSTVDNMGLPRTYGITLRKDF